MIKKRPLRADAERNRQKVLEVAQAVFAAEGLAVPIDEIARRAGLGVGTLYRHFPTKEALFEAIVVGRLESLVAHATERVEAADPGAAFFAFLSRMVEEGAAKRDFTEALASTGVDLTRVLGDLKKDLGRVMGTLLKRAQAVGAVRKDVGVPEIVALMTGAFASIDRIGAGPRARERLLAIVSDGLRGPAAPAPARPDPADPVGPAKPPRARRTAPVRIRVVGRGPNV
jgi:AcrR family transcriptional regulator